MSFDQLPRPVIDVLERAPFTEFATVSSAGAPIDTPTYCFPSDDLSHIGVATGLAYPAKAVRARNNPKVGLLIEGFAGQPVIAVRGMAAVRDADLQYNAERYIAETGYDMVGYGLPWEEGRKAVWYWTRLIVEVAPERILWWDNAAEMDGPPQVWQSPPGTVFPQSDPAPGGKASAAPDWPDQPTWQEKAQGALARGGPGHLTLCDADGFPLSFPARTIERTDDGFRLTMPAGLPWSGSGKATLSFRGVETFVGEARVEAGATRLVVERALPTLPSVANPIEVLQPSANTRAQFMARLEQEAQRRGQPIPTLADLPAPTRMAALRKESLAKMIAAQGGENHELP